MSGAHDRHAGWKPDPTGQFVDRWWDGEQWSDRVRNPPENESEHVLGKLKRTNLWKPGSKSFERQVKARRNLADLSAAKADRQAAKSAAASTPASNPVEAEIEALATEKLDMRFGVGREIKALSTHLHDDERLVTMARGGLKGAQGIVVVTSERVIFLDQRIVTVNFEDFPHSVITTISSSKAVLSAKVKLYAGSHSTEITDVIPKERGQEIVDAVRSAQAAAAAPSAAPAAANPAPGKLDQLEQLGRLRDAGVLTPDEFEAEKRKVLGL